MRSKGMAAQGCGSQTTGEKRPRPAHAAKHAVSGAKRLRVAVVGADDPTCVAVRHALAPHADRWTLLFFPTLHRVSRITHHAPRPPRVVLAAVGAPPLPGPGLITELKLLWPSSRLIVLLDPVDAHLAFSSLLAGADGCLVEPLARHDLAGMIERAAKGLPALCVDAQAAIIAEAHRHARAAGCASASGGNSPAAGAGPCALDAREDQVLACLQQGLLYKEITGRLHISHALLRKLQHRIFLKLHAANRAEAVEHWHSANLSPRDL